MPGTVLKTLVCGESGGDSGPLPWVPDAFACSQTELYFMGAPLYFPGPFRCHCSAPRHTKGHFPRVPALDLVTVTFLTVPLTDGQR